jgi:hypothetical protein
MNADEANDKIQDCNKRIIDYKVQLDSFMFDTSPENYGRFSSLMSKLESTIDELQEIISSIE